MRSSISAQSCDSVPPAPGWIVTIALRASFSPESKVSVSRRSTNWRSESISRRRSASTLSPSRARSKYAEMSSLWRMRSVSLANISSKRFFSRITVWDFCGFDQRFGSDACFSISVSRWRRLTASKILPKFADFIFQDCIFFFKFFYHKFFLREHCARQRLQGTSIQHFGCINVRLRCFFLANKYPRQQRRYRNYRTQIGEPIAMTSIEGTRIDKRIRRPQSSTGFSRRAGYDASVRIDSGSHACIRIEQQPAVIFDGSHARLFEMLRVGAAVAVPAVVRNIYQHLRSIPNKLANFIRKNGFVADEHAEFCTARIQRLSRRASGKISDFLGQASRKREHLSERNVLAERHQMNLVITRGPFASGAYKPGRVKHFG